MTDIDYLREAVEMAEQSAVSGGFPAGAVIVRNNQVIARKMSIGEKEHDPTAHGEVAAVRMACEQQNLNQLSDAVLYTSLESCSMCLLASYWAGIPRIVYGYKRTPDMVDKGFYEGQIDVEQLNRQLSSPIKLEFLSGLEDEIGQILSRWEKKKR